jgi:hypothetical protein
MPERLLPGQSADNAVTLCDRLEALRTSSTQDFDWLIDKWLSATESEQGLIRLDYDDEVYRIRRLATRRGVSVQIETLPVARSRCDGKSQLVRARILCVDAEGRVIKRSAGPVRWVMSWGATLSGVSVIS